MDDAAPILFVEKNDSNIIMLANGPIYFNIKGMRDLLLKTLNNELPLDISITADLGLIFNEYYHKASNSTLQQLKQQDLLIIEPYRLWEAYDNETIYVTWLYNNHNKNIIFEITPAYPYFYCNKKTEPHYMSYKTWIKSYKPYFKTIISKNIA